MNSILSFGSHTFLPQRQTRYEDNFRTLRSGTYRTIRADGGYDQFGTGRIPGAIGEIVFGIWLRDDDATLQSQLDAIGGLADMGLQTLSMRPSGLSVTRTCQARLIEAPYVQRVAAKSGVRQHVELVFEVPSPFWLGSEVTHTIQASGTQSDRSFTIRGTQTVYPTITVVPTGNISSFEIRRLVNGQTADSLRYQPTSALSSNLVFDCEGTLLTDGGQPVYSRQLSFSRGHWFSLKPGLNQLRVLLGANTATVTLAYQPRFR